MSDETSFRCPVCRAAQSLGPTCRRCRADLGLVVRAQHRLAYLKAQQAQAWTVGDFCHTERLAAELRWLAPGR